MNVAGTFNRINGDVEFLVTMDIVGAPDNVSPFTKYEVELVYTAVVGGIKLIENRGTGVTFLTDCGEKLYEDAFILWCENEADAMEDVHRVLREAVVKLQNIVQPPKKKPHGMYYGSFKEAKDHIPEQVEEPVVMILWQRDDILARLKDTEDDREPTEAQLDEILLLLGSNHDANLGITWDTIGSAITAVMGRW